MLKISQIEGLEEQIGKLANDDEVLGNGEEEDSGK